MRYDLQTSISTGNLVRVQVLMIDNKKNRDAALRLATIYNQPKIVTMALEQGADPHQLDELNRTPIAYAQQNGHDEIIALLETYQAAHPPQRDLNVDAFREQVLSGDLANMRHVYKAFKSIDDEDMSIEVEQDVIVQFLTQLRSETNQEESNTRWIPMANFLYKNSEAYRLLIKSISGQVCYDEPLKLGAGFLYSFIENNNLAGFKLMLAHGFPLNSIQLISRDNIFNALQMALIVYENDEISLPFIDALLEQGATLPKTDEALYLSPDKIWKLDKNQTELSEKIQSKAVARASVIGFVGQLLTMHEKPSFYRYLNELFQIKSIARFSEIANPMNAPQLISQLETEDDPFQTAINETLSFFSKPPCLDIAQIHEEPLEEPLEELLEEKEDAFEIT
jgi:hypothetical protein